MFYWLVVVSDILGINFRNCWRSFFSLQQTSLYIYSRQFRGSHFWAWWTLGFDFGPKQNNQNQWNKRTSQLICTNSAFLVLRGKATCVLSTCSNQAPEHSESPSAILDHGPLRIGKKAIGVWTNNVFFKIIFISMLRSLGLACKSFSKDFQRQVENQLVVVCANDIIKQGLRVINIHLRVLHYRWGNHDWQVSEPK